MIVKILAGLFILLLALDFKSDQSGGGIWQYFIVSASSACAVGGLIILPAFWVGIPTHSRRVILCGAGCLAVSAGVAYSYQVPMGNYVRMIFPVFLTWSGFLFASCIGQISGGLNWLRKIVIVTAVINASWTIYVALALRDFELDTVRYQIGSLGLVVLMTHAFTILMLRRDISLSGLAILLCVFCVQALTITRAYVLSWALLAFTAAVLKNGLERRRLIPRTSWTRVLLFCAVFGVMGSGVLAILESNYGTVTRWSERLWNKAGGRALTDVSFALRIAQDRGMLLQLKEAPYSILLGRGFGSEYNLDTQYLFSNVLSDLYQGEYLDKVVMGVWQKPDTTWVPLLQSGGLLFLGMFVAFLYFAFSKCWRLLLNPLLTLEERQLPLWLLFMLVFWVAPSLFGNILFLRYTTGVMGVVVGMIYIARVNYSVGSRPSQQEGLPNRRVELK